MKKLFCCGALAAVLASAAPAAAGELNLTITDGRVTLIAHDVTIRQILAEWARVGGTQIVNGEKMLGGTVTLELRDVPEGKALETVLRTAAGYVVAPRLTGRVGSSNFDRIVILATSRAPVVSAAPPAAFNAPRQVPQQQIMPPVEEEDERAEPQMAPGSQPLVPGSQPFLPGPAGQGMQPGQQQFPPNQAPQGPLTAPRPGQLPQPANQPGNPYQPQPGVRPPGTPGGPGGQPTRPGGGGGQY